MTKFKRILSFALGAVMAFAVSACTGDPSDDDKTDDKPYRYVEYDAAHTSADRQLTFVSSDTALDDVLNEYRERHMRYDPQTRIHTHPVGAGGSAWKEWESMAGFWWNTGAYSDTDDFYSTDSWVSNWVNSPKLDHQGYIWADNGVAAESWGLGWLFPNYNNGGAGYNFHITDSEGKIIGATTDGFTSNSGISVSAENSQLVLTGNNVSEITAVSPAFETNTQRAPFVKLAFTFQGSGSFEADDLYLYYMTDSDDDFSETKKVAFSEFCTTGFKIGSNSVTSQQGYFFPLYLLDDYGASRNTYVTRLKVALKAKKGTTLSGTLKLDYVFTDYDDRHSINPSNYIIAAKNYLQYTQNTENLYNILRYARKSMNFLLNQLTGADGLLSTEYFVGHYNDGLHSAGGGIGNGYWDVLAMPKVNLYDNISFYNALNAMAYLEQMADYYKIEQQVVTTKNAKMDGLMTYLSDCSTYAEKAEKLLGIADTCRTRIQTEFWNDKTERFHAGKRDDRGGTVQDNGYLMFNQQVIASGIATDEQAEKIMQWINGERKVSSDNSVGADIYRYEFAPRFNTKAIGSDFVWLYDSKFDENVQDGGATLHGAYYDVVSQAKIDTDKGFLRLKAIKTWFQKVKAAGGEGAQFYRKYFESQLIPVQGGGPGGVVGVDTEFIEAALLIAAVPEAFFGLTTLANNTLCVTPSVPYEMDFWRLENLTFAGRYYDLSAGQYFAEISAVSERTTGSAVAGSKVQFAFDEPDFDYTLLINGQTADSNSYAVSGGKITVTVPLANVKVRIIKNEPAQAV